MKLIASLAISVALFAAAHGYATTERGYEAIGGEVFAFAIPAAVAVAEKAKREW